MASDDYCDYKSIHFVGTFPEGPDVYISDMQTASTVHEYKTRGHDPMDVVINVSHEDHTEKTKQAFLNAPSPIDYCFYPADDNSRCNILLKSGMHVFLNLARCQKGQNVLVHCTAGISRSPTCVGFSFMKAFKKGYEDVFEQMRKLRPCIDPNVGFEEQLLKFQVCKPLDSFLDVHQKISSLVWSLMVAQSFLLNPYNNTPYTLHGLTYHEDTQKLRIALLPRPKRNDEQDEEKEDTKKNKEYDVLDTDFVFIQAWHRFLKRGYTIEEHQLEFYVTV